MMKIADIIIAAKETFIQTFDFELPNACCIDQLYFYRIQIYFDLSACMTRFCIFILIKKYCPHDTMTHFKMGNNFISTVLHNALTLKRRSHGCKME